MSAHTELKAVLKELRDEIGGYAPEDDGYILLRPSKTWRIHDALSTALERLDAAIEENERRFPMQDGPSIPWSLAERIYFVYADLFGERQSLETLAKRGGFGWAEIPVFRKEYYRKHGWLPDWTATVAALAQEKPHGATD